MPAFSTEQLDQLRSLARQRAEHAHVPYSNEPAAAILVLSDGAWIPGVRVESASYSLVIPALLNALTTAVALGRMDLAAVVLDHPATPSERALLEALPHARFTPVHEDVFVTEAADVPTIAPEPLPPVLDEPAPADEEAGIQLARRVAERAFVPASDFQVGCVLATPAGLVPGVNVEHPDWTRILCAERNALGTAVSYGLPAAGRLYLTCLKDDAGTPCGACRQVLVELVPDAMLWMDRGSAPPDSTTPRRLLPGFFTGRSLLHRPDRH